MGLEVKTQTQMSAVDSQFMTNRHSFNLAKIHFICFRDMPDELPLKYSHN